MNPQAVTFYLPISKLRSYVLPANFKVEVLWAYSIESLSGGTGYYRAGDLKLECSSCNILAANLKVEEMKRNLKVMGAGN